MVEGLPLELLQDALAGIGERGELRAATPVMARWLGARGVADLATLPLDAEQRAALQAGGAVLLQDGAESFELQRLEHDGRSWLRVRDVGERTRARAADDAAARVRSLGRLAGNIAHDLNNQLNAAVGLSAMLSPLARTSADRESLRALEAAVVHGARLVDVTARLLRRKPDPRPVASAAEVLADLVTMIDKALAVAEVQREVDAAAADLKLRGAHDAAVHAALVGVMAVVEGRPSALRFAVAADRRAIADGRVRDVVALRVEVAGLPEDFRAMLRRLLDVAPGALVLGAAREAFTGLVGMVASQRRHGGDVVVASDGDVLRVEWLWPRAGG